MKIKGQIVTEYILATIGVVLTAIGLVSFLIPNNIAAGGASGLSIVLHAVLPFFPVGIWMYIVNIVLFILAFIIVGFDFSYKTIYSTFMLSFFIDLFDRKIPFPKYTGSDIILAVLFGNILTAIGMAITFSQNSSTGGTDIIAKIINKYFNTPMGITLLGVDFAIGVLAGFTFNVETGMYSILAIIINGTTIDFVLKGLELSIVVTVISGKEREIADFVMHKLKRGVTYIQAKGGYTEKKREMLYIALKRRELGELMHAVRKIDPEAFVVISEARYVLGEGFKDIR